MRQNQTIIATNRTIPADFPSLPLPWLRCGSPNALRSCRFHVSSDVYWLGFTPYWAWKQRAK